jgi:hypothetical protein
MKLPWLQPLALSPQPSAADLAGVQASPSPIAAGWNWRLSAHFRVASLASAWGLVFLSGILGPLVAPLAAVRFCFSMLQTWLNVRLGRAQPVEKQDRTDWVFVACVFAGAYAAIGIGHLTGQMYAPVTFLPMLIPFSALQVRMALRSYRAHAEWNTSDRLYPFPNQVEAAAEAA